MLQSGSFTSYFNNRDERIYHKYVVNTHDGFEVKFNTPNAPTIRAPQSNVTQEIHTCRLNNLVMIDPGHGRLEHHLVTHIEQTESFTVDPVNQVITLKFNPPVTITDYMEITLLKLLY